MTVTHDYGLRWDNSKPRVATFMERGQELGTVDFDTIYEVAAIDPRLTVAMVLGDAAEAWRIIESRQETA